MWGDIGTVVLGNSLNGFDATVMAYGQTGAGKTYSVLGHPPELGVVPRAVHALFDIVMPNLELEHSIESDRARD